MSESITAVLMGATAMASFVAALFFVRFWQQTRDIFFLWFALAFGCDAVTRLFLGMTSVSADTEPLVYLARLLTFVLIIAAIVQKNRPGRSS